MEWLLARQIRPFIRLAALASLLLNLALLAPALYMLQVFDRVFASGSIETLVMLSIPVWSCWVWATAWTRRAPARSPPPAAASRACLAPEALASELDTPRGRPRGAIRTRCATSRSCAAAGSPGVVALFDAPWVPLYLLIITLMHPLLGGIATLGALAAVRARPAHRVHHAPHTEQAMAAARATQRRTEALMRNAESVVAMGMTGAALAAWQAALRRAAPGAGASSAHASAGSARWRAWRGRVCRRWRWDSAPGW